MYRSYDGTTFPGADLDRHKPVGRVGEMDGCSGDTLFLVALATLSLQTERAARGPLLFVADDAQWLDQPTHDVLAFISRRLSSDRVVLSVAMRDEFQLFAAVMLPPSRRSCHRTGWRPEGRVSRDGICRLTRLVGGLKWMTNNGVPACEQKGLHREKHFAWVDR
ncbi:hypothetical protein [Bradyrhizobium sp. BR 1432]|uniref:hypothetical protein n=1 Tax=Bradyrhizobium sp. BR 1432 TaxID=3447966 RepID=UPI003EE6DCD8